MSRVFLDSNLFIYFVEDEFGTGVRVRELISRMSVRRDTLVTSSMTVGEILVKPVAASDFDLIEKYTRMFKFRGVEIVDFDQKAASEYAQIRQDRTIKSPDAIQLACAAAAKCDLFVTNDDHLSKKIISGIQFITSLDRVPI